MTPVVTLQPSQSWWKQTVCMNATTHQLINFYHATLKYAAVSMLVKAINKDYLKGFAGLTLR
jgi:hypothetical protein